MTSLTLISSTSGSMRVLPTQLGQTEQVAFGRLLEQTVGTRGPSGISSMGGFGME